MADCEKVMVQKVAGWNPESANGDVKTLSANPIVIRYIFFELGQDKAAK